MASKSYTKNSNSNGFIRLIGLLFFIIIVFNSCETKQLTFNNLTGKEWKELTDEKRLKLCNTYVSNVMERYNTLEGYGLKICIDSFYAKGNMDTFHVNFIMPMCLAILKQ